MTDAVSTDDLFDDLRWLHSLALVLTRDSARAEDLVQSATVAYLESPPDRPNATAAWLRSVVRNLARRNHRDETRRRRREQQVARREAVLSTPDGLLEQAEIQRQLIDAVLALDEPYQETILLRYFGELAPKEIAERHRVPIATVYTRLDRATDRLRARLDSAYGHDRAAWISILIPLADPARAPLSLAAATSSTTAAASGLSLATFGGTVMGSKTALLLATLVGVVALAAGIGIERFRSPDAESNRDLVARSHLDAAEATNQQLRSDLEAAQQQIASLASAAKRSAAETRSLEEKLAALEAQPTRTPAESADEPGLPISFGKWADLEDLTQADWAEIAGATHEINRLLLGLIENEQLGKDAPPEFQQAVQVQNAKLLKFYAGIVGKIPTEAPVNGEFTHPVALSNILNAMVDAEGLPLDDRQHAEFERIGSAYDHEYERLQASYTADTLKIEKILDELSLKGTAKEQLVDTLSPDQRERILHPEIQDRSHIDTLSPGLMLMGNTEGQAFASRGELRSALPDYYAGKLGIPASELEPFAPLFDRYLDTVDAHLVPCSKYEIQLYTWQEAEAAGRAHLEVLHELMSQLPLDEQTRARLRSEPTWKIPRIVE